MLLVKKCQTFLYLDLIKIRVEKMLNNFAEKEETFFWLQKQKFLKVPKMAFFYYKNKILQSAKNCIFPKGLTDAFGQKMPIFSWFVFA